MAASSKGGGDGVFIFLKIFCFSKLGEYYIYIYISFPVREEDVTQFLKRSLVGKERWVLTRV